MEQVEEIQTRGGLEDGGMRGQVCAVGPYKAWMTATLRNGWEMWTDAGFICFTHIQAVCRHF